MSDTIRRLHKDKNGRINFQVLGPHGSCGFVIRAEAGCMVIGGRDGAKVAGAMIECLLKDARYEEAAMAEIRRLTKKSARKI